jgi:hypothetical protein
MAAVALCPYGLGQPAMFRGWLVPVGVEMVDMWK